MASIKKVSMIILVIILGFVSFFYLYSIDHPKNTAWARYLTSSIDQNLANIDLVVDKKGNVYNGYAQINHPKKDSFVLVKYDLYGDKKWTRKYSAPGFSPMNLSLDKNEDLIVLGKFYQRRKERLALFKYTSSGKLVWRSEITNLKYGYDIFPGGMTLDNNNDINLLIASGWGKMAFILVKYDSKRGTQLWKNEFSSNKPGYDSNINISSIDVDSKNNLFLLGDLNRINNDPRVFLKKYSPEGDLLWDKKFAVNTTDKFSVASMLTINNSNDISITTITPEEDNISLLTTKFNFLITNLDSSGNTISVKKLSDRLETQFQGFSKANDRKKNVYLWGPNKDQSQIVISKYDSGGKSLWSKNIKLSVKINGRFNNCVNLNVAKSGYFYVTYFNFVVQKFNPDGKIIWSKRYKRFNKNWDCRSDNTGVKVFATDEKENVYMSGTTLLKSGKSTQILTVKFTP